MDALEWFQFALLAGAALVGIAVGVLHMYGWVPPRYRRMLSEVQRTTADAISTSLRAEISTFVSKIPIGPPPELTAAISNFTEFPNKIQVALHAELTPLSEGIQAGLHAELAPLAEGIQTGLHAELQSAAQALDSGIKALPTQLSAAVAPIADGMGKAVADGFGAVLAELGGSAQAAAIQPAAVDARITNSLAKQGAKKLLASMAAGIHPAAGLAVGLAQGIGVLDDATAERVATFLIDNPELMAQINSAGQRIAQARGITLQGTPTGVGRTLAGAER